MLLTGIDVITYSKDLKCSHQGAFHARFMIYDGEGTNNLSTNMSTLYIVLMNILK